MYGCESYNILPGIHRQNILFFNIRFLTIPLSFEPDVTILLQCDLVPFSHYFNNIRAGRRLAHNIGIWMSDYSVMISHSKID